MPCNDFEIYASERGAPRVAWIRAARAHPPRDWPGTARASIDMRYTCAHAYDMSMIQIRNVPEPLHRELKARAARVGMTLSDYLLDIVRDAAAHPEPEELLRRVRERSAVYPSESPADAVRAERDAR